MTRRRHDEEGVTLVLITLLMVVLLTMVAIVIDVSDARSVKRTDQSAADFAAIAAGFYLSGNGNQASPSRDAAGACRAAVDSLKANLGGLDGATDSCGSAALAAACVDATTVPADYPMAGVGDFTITIRYPVSAEDITTPYFTTGTNDGLPCERMKVTVQKRSSRFFSGVIGGLSLAPTASAVVRANLAVAGNGVPALLLLERSGCAVLATSGQGGVVVRPVLDSANPAIVQADSTATSGCSGAQASNYAMYATALPTASQVTDATAPNYNGFCNGAAVVYAGVPANTCVYPAIQARDNGTAKGVNNVYSLAGDPSNLHGYSTSPTGIYPTPLAPTGPASRLPIDTKYNNATQANGTAINDLRARAVTALGAALPAGRTLTNSECNAANLSVSDTVAIVANCDVTVGNGRTWTLSAPTVVVTGRVAVAGSLTVGAAYSPDSPSTTFVVRKQVDVSGTLSIPNAAKVYVQGCVSACGGAPNTDYAVNVGSNGQLVVNSASGTACNAQANTRTTELVQMSGPFVNSGSIRLCATTVLMGEGSAPKQITTTATAEGPTCSTLKPCPVAPGLTASDGMPTGYGYVSVTGGSGTVVDWTAPNRLTTEPTAAQPLEDLALWTESNGDSRLGGQGAVSASGLYFAPNAAVTFSGQANQVQPYDAQFVSRTLQAGGQGVMFLQPNPNNAVKIPAAGTSSLIR